MKKVLAAFVALSLTACSTFPADPGVGPGTPIENAKTKAGQALVVAWRAFDTLLSTIDVLVDGGIIKAGTPKALKIAEAVDRARNALNAATDAIRAGNGTDFSSALALAQKAIDEAKAAIGGA